MRRVCRPSVTTTHAIWAALPTAVTCIGCSRHRLWQRAWDESLPDRAESSIYNRNLPATQTSNTEAIGKAITGPCK